MTLTPRSFSSSAAIAREVRSDAPPAAACTTKVMSFEGNLSCAKDGVASARPNRAAAAADCMKNLLSFIFSLPSEIAVVVTSRWRSLLRLLAPPPFQGMFPHPDHPRPRAIEVVGEFSFGGVRIACPDQVEKLAVLRSAGLEVLVRRQGKTQQGHHDRLVALPYVGKTLVPRDKAYLVMEGDIRLREAGRIAGTRRLLHHRYMMAEPLVIIVAAPLRNQAHRQALDGPAQRIDLVDVVLVESCDSHAARPVLDKTLKLEDADGIADRAAADAVFCGEIDLDQPLATRQLAGRDGFAQCSRNLRP